MLVASVLPSVAAAVNKLDVTSIGRDTNIAPTTLDPSALSRSADGARAMPSSPTYAFETPGSFLADFGETATVGAQSAQVLMSEPGEDIAGGAIQSNQYEIEYPTAAFALTFGTAITIRSRTFTVLDSNMIDDGVFSRARLQS